MLHCGQSCPATRDYFPKLKPLGMLMPGDILPWCNHRVRCEVVQFERMEKNAFYYWVVARDGKPFGNNEPWVTRFYGPVYTLIEVE